MREQISVLHFACIEKKCKGSLILAAVGVTWYDVTDFPTESLSARSLT